MLFFNYIFEHSITGQLFVSLTESTFCIDIIIWYYRNRKNQNIKLFFQPNEESLIIFADRERIYQVITNLIKNGIKFTTGNEAKIEINIEKIKDKKENEWASVKIRDNGTGIDPEILPRLFTKFTTKSEFGGTGLGLYLSKNIVEAHGGTIRGFNNSSGEKGATFEFILPLYER